MSRLYRERAMADMRCYRCGEDILEGDILYADYMDEVVLCGGCAANA